MPKSKTQNLEAGTMSGKTVRIRIAGDADLTRAVLEAGRMTKDVGCDSPAEAKVQTAVSELVRNVLKYAGTGEVLLAPIQKHDRAGIRIIVQDRGPGIADVERATADHFSSGGTLGLGLPGVKRLADDFEISSAPGRGTRVTLTKWRTAPTRTPRSSGAHAARCSVTHGNAPTGHFPGTEAGAGRVLDWAHAGRPCVSELVSGDVAVVDAKPDVVLVALVDVLGHGPDAHDVATRAETFLRQSWTRDVVEMLRRLHKELTGTRGAAAGIAVLDIARGEVRYAGVGNTVARKFGPTDKQLRSVDGTLGHVLRSPVEQVIRLTPEDVLVLYTDGVRTSFGVHDYPQIQYESARAIANNIVQRFGKLSDDATCVALRYHR